MANLSRRQVFTYCCIMAAIEDEYEQEKKAYQQDKQQIHVERMQVLKHNYKQYSAIVQAETSPDRLEV